MIDPTYSVSRIHHDLIPLLQTEDMWRAFPSLAIDRFPWNKSGARQQTSVKMCYNDDAIALEFLCEDRHISSRVTELNGAVWEDSCVEFFASPFPDQRDYFNLEINACGFFLLGHGSSRENRTLIHADLAMGITIHSSITDRTKQPEAKDNGWRIVAVIPFAILSSFIGKNVQPKSGDIWCANVYRCGGIIDQQYGCWSHIESERPDFHRPEFFGKIIFI